MVSRDPRVAFVAHWDWVLYNFRLPLARAVRERGADVILICPPGRYTASMQDEGFRWIPWDVDRRGLSPLSEWGSVRQLTDIYRTEGPDLVHHFTIKPNVYGSIAAGRAGIRRVVNTFTGMGYVFTESSKARALRIVLTPLMKRLFHRPGGWTVFQNDRDRTSALQAGLVPADASSVIAGTGVDLARFPFREAAAPAEPTALMASRLIAEKGVREYVEAAQLLKKDGASARFLVAGEPDPGNPSSIPPETLDAWRRTGPVEFLGHQDDMESLLQSVDVAVLPTYYPEGVPKFLIEAAAVGLPIVASDDDPCRAVVSNGVNGYLVPAKDPSALANALGDLLKDPAKRAEFGRASRAIAGSFDETLIIEKYVALYRGLGLETLSQSAEEAG